VDDKTIEYVRGRPLSPTGVEWDQAVAYWKTLHSDADAQFDTVVRLDAATIVPQVTFVGAATEAVTDERTSFQAHELELEFGENVRVRGRDVSEGTLIALAVLALAHHSPGVRYVLLDDIDRGLHPLAQKALVAQLRGVLAARPDLKIICTSHSPYLVEHFQAAEVRVLGRKKNGDTVCKRLDQHPEWQKYKEHLDTGSYWASVGEEWVGQD